MAYTTVSLPFGGGVDTKTDPKQVAAQKNTLLYDCIFTNPKRITKRNGYDPFTTAMVGGGVWSSPTMSASIRNQVLLAATTTNGQRLISYSEDLNAWEDVGKYLSIAVSKQTIASIGAAESPAPTSVTPYGYFNGNSIVLGNIALYTYETAAGSSGGQEDNFGQQPLQGYYSILDTETGVYLAKDVPITNGNGFVKPALLGASQLAIFYIRVSTGKLCVRLVTVNSSGVSLGSEIVIATCVSSSGANVQYPYCYDYVTTATGAALGVADGNNLLVYKLTSSGTATLEATLSAGTGFPIPINLTTDSSGNIWVYWADSDQVVYVAIYTSSYGVVLATTTITSSSSNAILQIAAYNSSAGVQTVWITIYELVTVSQYTNGSYVVSTQVYTITTGGTSTDTGLRLPSSVYGKPFLINSVNYMPMCTYSQSQSTGMILDTTDGNAVAKFLPTECENIYTSGYDLSGNTYSAAAPLSGRYPGFLTQPNILSSTMVSIASMQVISSGLFDPTSSTNLSAFPVVVTTAATLTVVDITFDFDNIDAYQAVTQQETLLLNGGIVSAYDGASVTELGYTVDPDNLVIKPVGSGGSIPTGTFIYYLTYSWVDALGNLYESAPSLGITAIFASGSSNSVQMNIYLNLTTLKKGVITNIWRSDSNLGGNIAYLIGTLPSGTGGSYTDTLSTAAASVPGNPTLYTQNGAILENIAPPPAMILWTNNNRAWCIDSENPETTVEYSKTASSGTGVSFSTGVLEYLIDSKFGAVTGASPMDEKTVLMKQSGVGYFIGDGANDAGTGATLTPFQFIPSDTGCSNSKSVISYPQGLLFRASNGKGIYVVSRGLAIQYFGYDVAGYSTQDIQAAQIIGNKNQIRFLTSNGSSLLYDYVMQQWSVFTNHTGYSSTLWNGNYVYVRTDGSVYQENQSGTYLDNGVAIAPLIQMAWIKAGSEQGFQRTRRIEMLGDFQTANSGHGVQVSIAYDFNPTFSAPIPYYFTGSNGVFQYRERLPRQKCDAFQLQIQEIVTGASGEYIDFTDLGLEVLMKSGLNRLPGNRSVG